MPSLLQCPSGNELLSILGHIFQKTCIACIMISLLSTFYSPHFPTICSDCLKLTTVLTKINFMAHLWPLSCPTCCGVSDLFFLCSRLQLWEGKKKQMISIAYVSFSRGEKLERKRFQRGNYFLSLYWEQCNHVSSGKGSHKNNNNLPIEMINDLDQQQMGNSSNLQLTPKWQE